MQLEKFKSFVFYFDNIDSSKYQLRDYGAKIKQNLSLEITHFVSNQQEIVEFCAVLNKITWSEAKLAAVLKKLDVLKNNPDYLNMQDQRISGKEERPTREQRARGQRNDQRLKLNTSLNRQPVKLGPPISLDKSDRKKDSKNKLLHLLSLEKTGGIKREFHLPFVQILDLSNQYRAVLEYQGQLQPSILYKKDKPSAFSMEKQTNLKESISSHSSITNSNSCTTNSTAKSNLTKSTIVNRKMVGYCENCNMKYDDLRKHLEGYKHQKYSKSNLFQAVDLFIAKLNKGCELDLSAEDKAESNITKEKIYLVEEIHNDGVLPCNVDNSSTHNVDINNNGMTNTEIIKSEEMIIPTDYMKSGNKSPNESEIDEIADIIERDIKDTEQLPGDSFAQDLFGKCKRNLSVDAERAQDATEKDRTVQLNIGDCVMKSDSVGSDTYGDELKGKGNQSFDSIKADKSKAEEEINQVLEDGEIAENTKLFQDTSDLQILLEQVAQDVSNSLLDYSMNAQDDQITNEADHSKGQNAPKLVEVSSQTAKVSTDQHSAELYSEHQASISTIVVDDILDKLIDQEIKEIFSSKPKVSVTDSSRFSSLEFAESFDEMIKQYIEILDSTPGNFLLMVANNLDFKDYNLCVQESKQNTDLNKDDGTVINTPYLQTDEDTNKPYSIDPPNLSTTPEYSPVKSTVHENPYIVNIPMPVTPTIPAIGPISDHRLKPQTQNPFDKLEEIIDTGIESLKCGNGIPESRKVERMGSSPCELAQNYSAINSQSKSADTRLDEIIKVGVADIKNSHEIEMGSCELLWLSTPKRQPIAISDSEDSDSIIKYNSSTRQMSPLNNIVDIGSEIECESELLFGNNDTDKVLLELGLTGDSTLSQLSSDDMDFYEMEMIGDPNQELPYELSSSFKNPDVFPEKESIYSSTKYDSPTKPIPNPYHRGKSKYSTQVFRMEKASHRYSPYFNRYNSPKSEKSADCDVFGVPLVHPAKRTRNADKSSSIW
ncbi:hypothetical protein HDV01_005836 [Terramyces sp. JEL0728]|nr:hypothetical protein HDV01_005836 [Terramyces sp. JEL0728]